MTKTHHPSSRAERLLLKQRAKVQHTQPTHAKKRYKETLKETETRDELAKAARASRFNEYEPD